MRTQSLEFLKKIADTPSPSGEEKDVAKLFSDYVGPYADRIAIDINGNVLASINPDAETRIMLAGHMDEIGFIVQHTGKSDRRQRLLQLTPAGVELERELSSNQRQRVERAYGEAGIHAVEGFRKVMLGIITSDLDRTRFRRNRCRRRLHK